MSERRRRALLGALVLAFAALAVAINALLGDGPGEPAPPKRAVVERDEVAEGAGEPGATEATEPSTEGRRPATRDAGRARRAPREAPPPERRIERRDRAVLAEAGPVARRLLRAFALYEVGRLGREVRAELRASATEEFFGELVSQPPRLPPGARPERAGVAGAFQLLPVAGSPGGRELIEVELVGTLVRAGERTPIGVRMRREEGRWLVAGLTQ